MSAVVHPMPTPGPQPLLDKLTAAVRPEFRTELIHIDVDDPVFSRGRCNVGDCPRAILARRLCGAHLQDGTITDARTWRCSSRRPRRLSLDPLK